MTQDPVRHKRTALQRWGHTKRERLTEDPEKDRNPETEIQRGGPRETNTKNTGPRERQRPKERSRHRRQDIYLERHRDVERYRDGDPKRESKGQRERLREMRAEVSREIIRDRDEETVQRERRGWGKKTWNADKWGWDKLPKTQSGRGEAEMTPGSPHPLPGGRVLPLTLPLFPPPLPPAPQHVPSLHSNLPRS